MPLLMLLVFGIIEWGLAFFSATSTNSASRSGARTASALTLNTTYADQARLAVEQNLKGALPFADAPRALDLPGAGVRSGRLRLPRGADELRVRHKLHQVHVERQQLRGPNRHVAGSVDAGVRASEQLRLRRRVPEGAATTSSPTSSVRASRSLSTPSCGSSPRPRTPAPRSLHERHALPTAEGKRERRDERRRRRLRHRLDGSHAAGAARVLRVRHRRRALVVRRSEGAARRRRGCARRVDLHAQRPSQRSGDRAEGFARRTATRTASTQR